MSSLFSHVKAPADLAAGDGGGVSASLLQTELGGLSHNVLYTPTIGYGRTVKTAFVLPKGDETGFGAETGIGNVKIYIFRQIGQIKKLGGYNRSERRFEKGQISMGSLQLGGGAGVSVGEKKGEK